MADQPWIPEPRNPAWKGTGNLPSAPGWHTELPSAAMVPRLRALIEQGLPQAADISMFSERIYDQAQTPECSSHSAAAILSNLKRQQHGPGGFYLFDAHELFRAGHGTSAGGYMQDMDTVLDNRGGLRADTGQYYKETSWTVVPSIPGTWEDTVCAAIVAGRPVHQALLLWAGFGSNVTTGTPIQSEYHAVALVAYRYNPQLQFKILNSWGSEFGQGGFCWVDAAYLMAGNFQNGYSYSLVIVDASDGGNPNPPPPPPVGPRITGFSPAAVSVGQVFEIDGAGFGTAGGLAVFSPGIAAPVDAWGDTKILCRVPVGAITGLIGVNAGGREAFSGQPVTITSAPLPQPIDGTLTGQVGAAAITGPVHLAPIADGQYNISGMVRTK